MTAPLDLGQDALGDLVTGLATQVQAGRGGQPGQQGGIGKCRRHLLDDCLGAAGRSNEINVAGIMLQQADEVFRIPYMAAGDEGMGIGAKRPGPIAEIKRFQCDPGRPGVLIGMFIANSDRIGGILCQLDHEPGDFATTDNK